MPDCAPGGRAGDEARGAGRQRHDADDLDLNLIADRVAPGLDPPRHIPPLVFRIRVRGLVSRQAHKGRKRGRRRRPGNTGGGAASLNGRRRRVPLDLPDRVHDHQGHSFLGRHAARGREFRQRPAAARAKSQGVRQCAEFHFVEQAGEVRHLGTWPFQQDGVQNRHRYPAYHGGHSVPAEQLGIGERQHEFLEKVRYGGDDHVSAYFHGPSEPLRGICLIDVAASTTSELIHGARGGIRRLSGHIVVPGPGAPDSGSFCTP
jgi:hypothetical protein